MHGNAGREAWGDYGWSVKAGEVCRVLRDRNDGPSQRRLVDLAQDRTISLTARRALAQAFGHLSSETALEFLRGLVLRLDEDLVVRINAIYGLKNVGTSAVLAVLDSIRADPALKDLHWFAEQAAKSIREMKPDGDG